MNYVVFVGMDGKPIFERQLSFLPRIGETVMFPDDRPCCQVRLVSYDLTGAAGMVIITVQPIDRVAA